MTATLPSSAHRAEARLLAALDRASARPLVSLLAAHGSGKSALLEQWADERDVPVLVATDADRDPHHLTVRLVTALTHGRGGATPPDLGAAIDPTAPIGLLVERIITAAQDPPTRVAFDEVDRMAGSPSIDLLRALCAVPGSKVRLVTASRVDLGLLDDQVRSRGAGTTIDARQLALRPAEVEQRFARAIEQAGAITHPEPGPAPLGASPPHTDDGSRPMSSRPSLQEWAVAVHAATAGWAAGADAVMEALVGRLVTEDGDQPIGARDPIGAGDEVTRRPGATGSSGAQVSGIVTVSAAAGSDAASARVAAALRTPAVLATVEAFLLREERPAARHLVAEVALLDVTDAHELAAVQQRTVEAVRADLDDLLRRGLVQPGPGRPGYLDVGTVRVSPLVRVAMLRRLAAAAGPDPDALPEVLEGLERAGRLERVLTVTVEVGAQELTARMLAAHGARLLADGRAHEIARAAASIDDGLRTPALERLHGDALALLGDHDRALARLAAAGRPDDAGSVLAQVRLLVQRGELLQALHQGATLRDAGDPREVGDEQNPGADGDVRAELAAWIATAHLRRGDTAAAAGALAPAVTSANAVRGTQVGSDAGGPVSPAVVARIRIVEAALATATDATDEVYEQAHRRAFAAAELADDTRLVAQVRLDRARHHLDVGRTTEALFELDRAQGLLPEHGAVVEASEARALHAEVLLRTGRIDAAADVADVTRRIDEHRQARTSARGWYLLGDVHRQRGALDAARDAYERALAIAAEPGDRRPVAAASIGLARVLARTDALAARKALRAALEQPTPVTGALLTAGWLALADGDHATAHDEVQQARRRATPRRDERALAEAATLLALLDDDPVPGLRLAARTWHRLHDPLWAARTELGIARRAHGLDERSRLGDLELRLARLGVAIDRGEVAHELVTGFTVPAPVTIRVLGGFAVHHGGTRVDAPTTDDVSWLRARRMIQLLALRRGRSIAREELLGWLGLASGETVAFDATVAAAKDLVTSADGRAVALSGTSTAFTLRSAGIDLDLDAFERRARAGLRALGEGRVREADVMLRAAAAADGGPLLADEGPGQGPKRGGGSPRTGEGRADHVPRGAGAVGAVGADRWARLVTPIAAELDAMRADVEAGLRATDVLLGSIDS